MGLDDFTKDCQFRNLAKDTQRLPMILCAMVGGEAILDIWHTV